MEREQAMADDPCMPSLLPFKDNTDKDVFDFGASAIAIPPSSVISLLYTFNDIKTEFNLIISANATPPSFPNPYSIIVQV